jgi:hypothetical protein
MDCPYMVRLARHGNDVSPGSTMLHCIERISSGILADEIAFNQAES